MRRRARNLLCLVALAGAGAAASLCVIDGSGYPALVVLGIGAPGLWLTARGHAWARWALIVLAGVAGLGGLASSVPELVATTGSLDALPYVTASVSMLTVCALLHASETIRELGALRRGRGSPVSWETAGAPKTGGGIPGRVPCDPDAVRRRRLWGRIVSGMTTGLAIAAWTGFLVFTVWAWQEGTTALTRNVEVLQGSSSGALQLFWLFSLMILLAMVPAYLILAIVVLFLAPFLVMLPFTLPLAILWRRPARILVLRPFNRQEVSRKLKHLLREEVAPFGHCYTLADMHVRVSFWQRLPVLHGQLTFFTFRQRKILSPEHLESLIRAMARRVIRNLNWAFSSSKLFPVACVDSGWKACVRRMVHDCDAIVMDLSGISESIRWELGLLQETGAWTRTLFLCNGASEAAASAALEQTLGHSRHPAALVVYGDGEPIEPGLVASRIAHVLAH